MVKWQEIETKPTKRLLQQVEDNHKDQETKETNHTIRETKETHTWRQTWMVRLQEEQLGPNEDYARAAPPLEGQLDQVYGKGAPDLHKWTRFSLHNP